MRIEAIHVRLAKASVLFTAVVIAIAACSSQDDATDRSNADVDDASTEAGAANDPNEEAQRAPQQPTVRPRDPQTNVERSAQDERRNPSAPTKTKKACLTALDCQDGLLCNGIELCTNGQCTAGIPPLLDDGNPCTKDFCDEPLGVLHDPWPAGHACPNATLCDGNETCDGAGHCMPGTPPTVDDNNPCTDDACDPVIGVTHTPRPSGDTACSDGNVCNGVETCNGSGACQLGTPLTCNDNNACNGLETCNPTTGCQSGTPPATDDQNMCTIDGCDPATGPTHTLIPNCDPTPNGGDAPFETRASLLGKLSAGGSAVTGATFTVTDAPLPGSSPNPPRSDVTVSVSPDGSFRVRLTSFPEVESDRTPPTHVILRIAHASYLTAFRDAWLHAGDAVDFGVVKLKARDTNVTNIGPDGGTANDSLGRVQVVVPAGALSTTVPIVITSIPDRDEMPAPLPDNTPTLYGFELEPSGTTFTAPVSIRVDNSWRNAPSTIPIPTGYYDDVNGRWEHVGVATFDAGTGRFVVSTTHFSPFDMNYPRAGGPLAGPGPGNGPSPECGGAGGGGGGGGPQPTGSSCSSAHGSLEQGFPLPKYRVKNEDFGITLDYRSGPASSWKLGNPQTGYGVVAHSEFAVPIRGTKYEALCVPSASALSLASAEISQPGTCTSEGSICGLGRSTPVSLTLTSSLAGATASDSVTMSNTNTEAEFDAYVPLPLASATESTASGLYRMRTSVTAGTGSCISTGDTFAVSDPSTARTQTTLGAGPLATVDSHVLVHHRLTSPFGSGWGIREASRIYRSGDVAHVVRGNGEVELFRPRGHAKTLRSASSLFVLARDPVTGEIFAALDSGQIAVVNPTTGLFTTTLSGLAFNSQVHALAIGYVGGSRKFIVALANRLLEIDSGGAQTQLAARTAGAAVSQAAVAANGDAVFYADGNGAQLFRISLSDPGRTVTAMTLSTGGDVRVWPQATLSGVRFAEPRSLVFAPSGTLYLADRRRHVVYEILPDGTGVVSGSSNVRPIVGDGSAGLLPPLGERYPGTAVGIREPLGVTMSEDGYVVIATSYGFVLYDPVTREAEWLFTFGFIGEIVMDPIQTRFGAIALTATTFLSRDETSGFFVVRFDVDRMSSEFVPTRTLHRITGGQLELVDTVAETIEVFDAAGRMVERKRRTGETTMIVVYSDSTSNKIAKVVDAVGGETTFAYDGRGKIQSITDARGRTTQLTVNDLGDLVTIAEPGSETHSFVYDKHRMTEKHSPRNDVTTYAFRDDGTLQTATKPEGAQLTLDAPRSHPAQYDATTKKIKYAGGYTDQHGVAHQIVLNLRGEIEKDTYVIDGVTRTETISYPSTFFDRPTQSTMASDFRSQRRNFLFLSDSRSINGVLQGPIKVFDAHARPVIEYRSGETSGWDATNVHSWWYDANDWLMESYTSYASFSQHHQRDAAGHITKIFDSGRGNPASPSGRQTLFTYRADGLVATRTDHNVVRTFAYDDAGGTKNELGWTDTLGRSMTLTRDARGNVTSTSDGTATTYADFDLRNRVIATRDAIGNETTYGYAHSGCNCSLDDLVTSIHTPDLAAGVDWEMTYDGDRRLQSVTDPHGFTESYEYEPTGEMKKLTDKLARQTTWTHDSLGRVKTMLDTLGRHHGNVYTTPLSNAYSGPSLMAGSNDGTASTTSLTGSLRAGDYQIGHNAYQASGRPSQISLYRDATFQLAYWHAFDTAASPRQTYKRDRTSMAIDSTSPPPAGNGPFADEFFTWDTRTSRPLLGILGSDGVQNARFDLNFWLDTTFHRGHRTNATAPYGDPVVEEFPTRDTAGRITQLQRFFYPSADGIANPPAKLSTYAYRPDGRVSQIVNPDGTHDFTYNSRGLVQTQTVTGDGTYTYGYDELGRNDLLTFPDGHVRRQVYDDLGRITSRCYEYTGGPTTRCYTAQYDAVGNPTSMLDPEGEDIFEYDALDRLKKVTRKDTNGTVIEVDDYDYNALGALKKNANVVLDDQRPRLDGAGNAPSAVPATTPGGQAITLDAGGRITSLRGTTFTWTKKGYVLKTQEPTPALPDIYGVDAELRRTVKYRGTTVEYYFYEGLDRVATLNGAGALREGYLFDGIDHPLRIKVPATSTVAYYELDLAGNVRRLRNSAGSDLGGYRYTAFGQTKEDTTTLVQPLRWKARWHSTLNGAEVYDVRARQWAPEIGVFISVDEYSYQSKRTTLWGWPAQNPVRFRDPGGHGPDNVCTWFGSFLPGWFCEPSPREPEGDPPSPPSPGPGPGGPPPGPGGGGPGGGDPYRTPGEPDDPDFDLCKAMKGGYAEKIACCQELCGHHPKTPNSCPNTPSARCFQRCRRAIGF